MYNFLSLDLLSGIQWQVRLSDFGRWKPMKTTAGSVVFLAWRGCVAVGEAEEEEEMGRQVCEDWNVHFSHTWDEHTHQTWPFPFHWLICSWPTAQAANRHPLLTAQGVWPVIPKCEPIACDGWLADRWGGEEIKLMCGVCPQWQTYSSPCRSPASNLWLVQGGLGLILAKSYRETLEKS